MKACRIKDGAIKNPYNKVVCGVGYFGVGEYSSRIYGVKTKSYNIWRGMLKRCYCGEDNPRNSSYSNHTVDVSWHNFQNFAKWFEENYVDGWELDKDLLQIGLDEKIYSDKTCIFLSPKDNKKLMSITSKKNSLTGESNIRKRSSGNFTVVICGECLGTFKSIKDAIEARDNYKKDVVAELMKNVVACYHAQKED